ncbi:MAG: FAD-dependent oxidoreductase [bacterium]|nr:FAD-dependent oxidoreductase [bacterium]
MDRRYFLKLAAAFPTLPAILQSCDINNQQGFNGDIQIFNDMNSGHMVFGDYSIPVGSSIETEYLIVGGGIAGISAAASIKGKDFVLCELSSRLGGTSASANYNDMKIAQGAHYDLEYPENYGDDILSLFEEKDIIYHQPWKHSWAFTDEQYVVPDGIKNKCFDHGTFRADVLEEGPIKDDFLKLMDEFSDQMVMPTRLVDESLHYLNDVTFIDFLKEKIKLSDSFIRGLDYHMLDDWGGTASQVSALAGIHYFKCRPYYKEIVQLFSPPQGNSYFIDKMSNGISKEQLLTGHVVKSLEREGEKWIAEVIDVQNRTIKKVISDKVIYAGQKHALKFIAPEYAPLFFNNEYAPWLVMNFVLHKPFDDFGFWQNEMIVDDQSFLGFINSNVQHRKIQDKQVLTAYYCLPSGQREFASKVSENKEVIVQKTMSYLDAYFGESIEPRLESVLINAMGHAMAIPKPGHLFRNVNIETAKNKIAFAGVDNARLPILMEAVDSGLEAVRVMQD